MPEQSQQDKDMDIRLKLFSTELDTLQKKYMLRLIAQMQFPGGAILNVPLTALPTGDMPSTPAPIAPETASTPE